jgi:YgiT-type zinc finger domain-containing protein
MCNVCFSDDKIKTKTTFTVEYKGGLIVVKNVPCLECPACGEVTFENEVSEHLEVLLNAKKILLQELAVIDYEKAGSLEIS